jgi:hypothetical protein
MPKLSEMQKKVMSFNVSGGMFDKGKDFSIEAEGEFWNWNFNSESPSVIHNVRCNSSLGMSHSMLMGVCEEIAWKAPEIKFGGKDYKLELDKKHLLKCFYTSGGKVSEDKNGFWYECDLDPSLLLVFGFAFAKGAWYPIPEQFLQWPDFMPDEGGELPSLDSSFFEVDETFSGPIRPAMIIVFLELACLKADYNCEPSGMVKACRIHPQQYIVANASFALNQSVTSAIRQHTSMPHGPFGDNDDRMTDTYSVSTFTDSNSLGGLLAPLTIRFPYWHGTFSYYKPDNRKEFIAVDSVALQREILGASSFWSGGDYVLCPVSKNPRQGAYDNLHIAPVMMVPRSISSAFTALYEEAQIIMADLHMAPACVHDCLHFHWRWGDIASKIGIVTGDPKRFCGWDDGKPFSISGAPLVPKNQDVYIKPIEDRGFEYKVVISHVLRGQWQYIFHHGMYYPVAFDGSPRLWWLLFQGAFNDTRDLLPDDLKPLTNKSWAMLYFNLRYSVDRLRGKIVENLKFDLDKVTR